MYVPARQVIFAPGITVENDIDFATSEYAVSGPNLAATYKDEKGKVVAHVTYSASAWVGLRENYTA